MVQFALYQKQTEKICLAFIENNIKSLEKYNGTWESDNYRIEIQFHPRKTHYVMSPFLPISIKGLVNYSIKREIFFFPNTLKASNPSEATSTLKPSSTRTPGAETVKSKELFAETDPKSKVSITENRLK